MCVTSGEAQIANTRTYVYATTDKEGSPLHVSGYQNEATSLVGPNCMFLNFAGTDLRLVNGPEHTTRFMRDMTDYLPELVYVPQMRGGGDMFGSYRSATVIDYGDYTVVSAEDNADILGALASVREDRRPQLTSNMEEMLDFYQHECPNDSFVLGCFNGAVKPKHPIVVSYKPRNSEVLTIPGLDGHDGRPPVVGAPVYRGFRVAFGVEGVGVAHTLYYNDAVNSAWAPASVVGFFDNRTDGPNGDYVVPISAVKQGLTGAELADRLLLAA